MYLVNKTHVNNVCSCMKGALFGRFASYPNIRGQGTEPDYDNYVAN
jgi:hypothetical protein